MNIKSAVALTLVLGSSVSMAECVNPDAPDMPEGAKASMQEMIAGQNAVKAFQTANIEYMGCLEKIFNEAEPGLEEGSDDEKAAKQAVYDKALNAYNNAVSKEEAVAGQFNKQIGEFKAANPG